MLEFIFGGFVGIYLAQSCVLPNLQDILTKWIVDKNNPETITPDIESEEKSETFTGKMPSKVEMNRMAEVLPVSVKEIEMTPVSHTG
jgi:hypothetical protein